ncbi:MAG: hypothetical protein RBR23_00840 [Arcobacteraceae bacterium]|jgi:energy-coupling factor transporter ATP-binding protein EcfA2|nr:hypothetical protein [Arcobacteraceae bacterium]
MNSTIIQKKEQITIKIEESLDASKKFEVENLLQKKAIEKIQKLVTSRLINADKCNNKDCENDRKHDTITILGERGSGKTSLLLNLEAILKNNKDELVFLKIIDPTLFETKQNILVSIISLIADEIKNANKSTDDKWNESLIKLADGLKLLDGVGSDIIKSDLFDDGELILEKGLDHAHSGLNLEKYLSCYISQSLSLLDKKMFVLVFDDIDTNIDKGWMVLETIRKYLTSCQLQVFVSGHWELYSSLVRMKQWENFDRKIFPEKEWQDKKDLVDDLEEQYLIKVLKPEYRIYLENLYHLTTNIQYPEIIIQDSQRNDLKIDDIYEAISEKLFNFKNKKHQTEISNLIKFLPVRTNMKILYLFVQNQNNHIEMINEISNVFVTNTARFGFTHLDYENLSTNTVIQEMAKKLYLISNDKFSFSNLSQFPMNVSDKNLNLLLMVINLHLTKTLNTNMYTFFEWLTRFTYLDILSVDIKETDDKNNYLDILKYNYIIPMNEQIRLIGKIFEDNKGQRNSLLGFRKTYAFDRYAKESNFLGVDKFEKDANLDERFLLNIVLSKAGKVAHSEQSSVSVINIFAFLADFLQRDIKDAENYLFNLFEEQQYINYDDNPLFAEQFAEENKEKILNSTFYKTLLEWHKLSTNIEMFSLMQVSNIWKEFINKHTSNNLQDKKFNNLKDFLSSQIIVFFNLVITEILINQGEEKIYSSVNTSTNLYRNIKLAYGETYEETFYEKIDLFKFMYMCPVLYCLVEDANFVEPKGEYWIGKSNIDKIKTSFGKLGIQGGSNQEIETDLSTQSFDAVEKYISMSDLRKVSYRDPSTIVKIIDQIKKDEIVTIDQLWSKIKPPKTRITTEREAILKRFLSNVQNDVKTDD